MCVLVAPHALYGFERHAGHDRDAGLVGRKGQWVKARRVTADVRINEVYFATRDVAGRVQPRDERSVEAVGVASVRVDDAYPAAFFDVLADYVFEKVGLTSACGSDNV